MNPKQIAQDVLSSSQTSMLDDEIKSAIRKLDDVCESIPNDPMNVVIIRHVQDILHEVKARCFQAEIAGMEAARDIAVENLMCSCPAAQKITEVPPNSAMRWNLCSQPYCAAIEAMDIQAAINAAIKKRRDQAL
jgi:hypothetical protein